MELLNKHIVVAVCGGIAAYKSAELLRQLQRQGAQVRVVMTNSATRFVTPLTFQALSGHPVHTSDNGSFDPAGMDHIALARWSDLIIVAPASANMIAKLANGLADEFVSSLCLAQQGKLAVAPAMNQAMWGNCATQDNIARLQQRAITIIGPAHGAQACGETGLGRMLEPEQIVRQCISLFHHQSLSAQSVVITAGPTLEAIDPVRYISNRSSGKMGYALAQAALEAGANVIVITGPTHLPRNERIRYVEVESAQQMHNAALEHCQQAQIFIATAAVADYTPSQVASQKIKKTDSVFSLQLSRNKDIVQDIKQRYAQLYCVGFAAETENLLANARCKLHEKSLNMVIANDVSLSEQGFNSDYNAVEIITPHEHISVSRMRKNALARVLIEHIANLYKTQTTQANVTVFNSK